MNGRRRVTAAALTASMVLTGSACGGGGGGGTSEDGTVQLAVGRMAAGVDPVDDLSSSYLRSYGAAESLLKVQPDGTVEPELAESVEQTGPEEWTVTLREGVEFWGGDPVDAAAVVASYERSRENSTLATGLLDGVTLEAADPRTVVFGTDGPSPFFEYTLSSYALAVHNAGSYEGADPTDAAAGDLTGPYRVTGFETDRSVTLEANPTWWGGEVGASGVEVQLVPDEQSRAEVALSGQADIVQDLPSARSEEAAAAGLEVVAEPAATTVSAYLNADSPEAPALGDLQVRQALAMAVDRQEVVDLATDGLSAPTASWLASAPTFPEAREQGWPEPDPDGAEALLDRAGWTRDGDGTRTKDGEPLRFELLTFGVEAATGQVLQSQWAEIGVEAQVRNVEDALVVQSLESGDWQAVTQAWTSLGNVPELIANQAAPTGAANHGAYRLAGVEDLLRTAQTDDAEDARRQAVLDVNQLLVDTVPMVPLHTRPAAVALADGVEGFLGHPLQYETIVTAELTVP